MISIMIFKYNHDNTIIYVTSLETIPVLRQRFSLNILVLFPLMEYKLLMVTNIQKLHI